MRVSVSSYSEEGVGAERAYKLRFLRQRQSLLSDQREREFLLSIQLERFGCLGTAASQQYVLACFSSPQLRAFVHGFADYLLNTFCVKAALYLEYSKCHEARILPR